MTLRTVRWPTWELVMVWVPLGYRPYVIVIYWITIDLTLLDQCCSWLFDVLTLGQVS